jgi:hypothetical protein
MGRTSIVGIEVFLLEAKFDCWKQSLIVGSKDRLLEVKFLEAKFLGNLV